jgi:hypothetical protein
MSTLKGMAKSNDMSDPHYAQAVRLRQLWLPGAGAFLDARPSGNGFMGRGSMMTALCLRIGASVGVNSSVDGKPSECPRCVSGCRDRAARGGRAESHRSSTLDARGTHALCTCPFGGDKGIRHDAIVDVVERTAARALRPTRREMRTGTSNSQARPGDLVFLNGGRAGKHLFTDVTVSFSGKPSKTYHLTAGQHTEGDAGNAAQQKYTKYRQLVESEPRYEFLALAANHFGGWERRSAQFLRKLGGDASVAFNPRFRTSVYLFRELSVRIQNCNYDAIMRRRPGSFFECAADVGGAVDDPLNVAARRGFGA